MRGCGDEDDKISVGDELFYVGGDLSCHKSDGVGVLRGEGDEDGLLECLFFGRKKRLGDVFGQAVDGADDGDAKNQIVGGFYQGMEEKAAS